MIYTSSANAKRPLFDYQFYLSESADVFVDVCVWFLGQAIQFFAICKPQIYKSCDRFQ